MRLPTRRDVKAELENLRAVTDTELVGLSVDDLLAELARRGIRGAEFIGHDTSSPVTL